jgi:hypothetical protein
MENIGAVMATIYNVKPENYGKGKKKANKKKTASKQQPKYLLSAYLSSTQGKGLKLDLRTVDPTSPFFLSDADPLLAKSAATTSTTAGTASNEEQPPPASPSPILTTTTTSSSSIIGGGGEDSNTTTTTAVVAPMTASPHTQ